MCITNNGLLFWAAEYKLIIMQLYIRMSSITPVQMCFHQYTFPWRVSEKVVSSYYIQFMGMDTGLPFVEYIRNSRSYYVFDLLTGCILSFCTKYYLLLYSI